MARHHSTVFDIFYAYRDCWKSLAVADIAYKIIAFVVLTPLVGVLFRVLMAVSGRVVLADEDILHFLLGPAGWICFIAIGALWLGIVALEQATLLHILCARRPGQDMRVLQALRLAAVRGWPVIQVTARMAALTLFVAAPFLIVAGVIYQLLLTQFDINFYLSEKPPVFWVAVVSGAVIASALAAVLLRLFTGWLFALPLVLFEGVRAGNALRVSSRRTHGHRRRLLLWIVVWFVGTSVLSAVISAATVSLGRWLVPLSTNSIPMLLVIVGAMLMLWSVVNLAINLLSATTFATMVFHFYRRLGGAANGDFMERGTSNEIGQGIGFQLTKTKLVAAAMVAIVLAAAVGYVTITSVRIEDHTQITAHRGASASAPENTLAAVSKAIEDGADWVEIDVQEIAEGTVVVFHDSDFKKLAGVDLRIWDATLDDLRKIDIGSRFGGEFKDERVPTLDEVLKLCRGKIRVNIELKYYGHDQQLEQRVAEIVETHRMQEDIVIMSLKSNAIGKMKSLRPDWKVGLLTAVAAGDLTRVDADFLAVSVGLATRSFIRSAHRSGKDVHVWTVNDPLTMSAMMGRGVDALITDKPALARSVLRQRAALRAPERLLLSLAGVFDDDDEVGEP